MERLTLVLPTPRGKDRRRITGRPIWIAESAISTAAAQWSGIRSTANGWIESTLCKNCRYRKSILRRPPFCGAGTGWTNCGNHSDPAPVDRRAVPQRWEYRLRRAAGRTEKGICITDADAGTGFLPQNRFGTGIAGLPETTPLQSARSENVAESLREKRRCRETMASRNGFGGFGLRYEIKKGGNDEHRFI